MTEHIAIFGGGCFWCTEAVFRRLNGVTKVEPGYAGGTRPNPNYFKVSEGISDHAEVIQLHFDPSLISYEQLLDVFFAVHDPTTLNRQGADEGPQYRSLILTTTPEQKKSAIEFIKQLQNTQEYRSPIVTSVQDLDMFYPAESYHFEYYEKNQSQPYCQVVISPKLEKLKKRYPQLMKQ